MTPGADTVPTHPPRLRRWLPATILVACAGCSAVHQREALYPNGQGQVVEGRKGFLRGSRARAPLVKLGVEPTPAPAVSEPVSSPAAIVPVPPA